MDLETWLWQVPVLALKAFAEEMPQVRTTPKEKVVPWILANPTARDQAMRSKQIEERVLNER